MVLRETREGFGEDIAAVAQALRIRLVYLQAIEDGRFDDLPGHTYAVGFVRTYAHYLGLDGEKMVLRFKDEVRGLERKSELVFPTPVPEGKVPGGAIILVSLLLVALAYGGWFYLSDRGQTVVDLIPDVPQHLQDLLNHEDAAGDVELAAADPEPRDEPQASESAEPLAEPRAAESPEPETADIEQPGPAAPATALPEDATPVAGIDGSATQADETPDGEPALATGADDAPSVQAAAEAESPPQFQLASGDSLAGDDAGASGEQSLDGLSPVGSLAEVIALNAPSSQGQDGTNPSPISLVGQTVSADESNDLPAEPESAEIPEVPATTQLADLGQDRNPRVYGSDNQNARIVLRAKYDSWVQVRDGEDTLLLTRVLRAGDSYRVPDQAGLTLLTGNAGGLEIVVDGQQMAPLGPIGSVRRNILLDPGRLVDGSAVPQ